MILNFKTKIIVLATILISCQLRFFAQSKFANAVEFSTRVSGDFVNNFFGGFKKGYTYIGMEDLTLSFETSEAGWWKNGTLFIHGLNTHGKGPSEILTGDLQIMSNIESGDYTGLYEFWYMQKFGHFSVLLGKHDLNTEFVGTKYGGTFINSSFGIAPSISLNVPVSIYPVAAPCIMIKYENENKFACKLAVYDGDPGNIESNRFGIRWNVNTHDVFLSISEIQYFVSSGDQVNGIYKIGGFYHSGRFLDYTDTLFNKRGDYGFYIVADQSIFPRSLNAGRGLCYFFQGGFAPSNLNMVQSYIGTGFRYHGILPYRFNDELGIAIACVGISKDYRKLFSESLSYETSWELTYIFRFGGRYSIQPSAQYIINPGANKNINNCLAGLLRFSLTY